MEIRDLERITCFSCSYLRGALRRLQKKGLVQIVDGQIVLTEKGWRVVNEEKLYGYSLAAAVRDVIKIRDWVLRQKVGSEFTLKELRRDLPGLTVHNKKIGRVLRALGCGVRKSRGQVVYRVPDKVKVLELRDLTRVKRKVKQRKGGEKNGKKEVRM